MKKCYKFNEASCCTILHDTYISEYTSSLIIDACLRKYPEFEDLLCFVCSPLQEKYIDTTAKTFKVCQDFAMKIWNASTPAELNQKSTRFDNCGFLIPDHLNGAFTTDGYFMPSVFGSFGDFINKIQLPYFPDYTVEVIDGNNLTCFTKGSHLFMNVIFNVLILIMLIA